MYLHVPFCRNGCPYCPYTKVAYDQSLVEPFTMAMLAEVDVWADSIGPAEVTSVYIGGGTPTLATGSLARILSRVRERFRLTGEVCIETSPSEVDGEIVHRLRDMGVTLVSLGVQSFQPEKLALIGRRYGPSSAEKALGLLARSGFASVNADLMFALPGQTVGDVLSDLSRAEALGADQVTAYPLFTFPYSSVGEYLHLKHVVMPELSTRRTQYGAINAWCVDHGFQRVSVWGFRRGSAPRYSSVTRDGYVGLGPGAGSHLPDGFVLNSFDLEAWAGAVRAGKPGIALRMPFAGEMAGWWWLYWRLYDTRIPMPRIDEFLGADAAKARWWLGAAERVGLAAERDGLLELTESGAFWLHLLQNHFALHYVNTLWTAARREPWPVSVPF